MDIVNYINQIKNMSDKMTDDEISSISNMLDISEKNLKIMLDIDFNIHSYSSKLYHLRKKYAKTDFKKYIEESKNIRDNINIYKSLKRIEEERKRLKSGNKYMVLEYENKSKIISVRNLKKNPEKLLEFCRSVNDKIIKFANEKSKEIIEKKSEYIDDLLTGSIYTDDVQSDIVITSKSISIDIMVTSPEKQKPKSKIKKEKTNFLKKIINAIKNEKFYED